MNPTEVFFLWLAVLARRHGMAILLPAECLEGMFDRWLCAVAVICPTKLENGLITRAESRWRLQAAELLGRLRL